MIFPVELIEVIIDFLDDEQEALRNFSLTCRSFLPPCQKRLFSDITWTSNEHAQRFDIFAHSSPHLLRYINSFSFSTELYPTPQAMAVISCFSTLERLELNMPNTTRLSPERSGWLTTVLSSHRLTHLHIKNIHGLPVSIFRLCKSLQHLVLLSLITFTGFPEPSAYDSGPAATEKSQLKSLNIALIGFVLRQFVPWLLCPGSPFDFSQLDEMRVVVEEPQDQSLLLLLIEVGSKSIQNLGLDPPLDCKFYT